MASAGAKPNHDYHLVNPSPWPFVGSLSLFIMAIGGVVFMKGLVPRSEGTDLGAILANQFLAKGDFWLLLLGLLGILYTMFGWWSDVIKESKAGDHTPVVDIGLRYGMILFIASEVMFFVAWFWSFFELALFHQVRTDWFVPAWSDEVRQSWANWPPPGVETFDPWHLPLMNTLILLLSGTTVTWAHHALQHDDRKGAKLGLWLTVILGISFTALQAYEYTLAGFHFGSNPAENISANLYGASFFMATGFHGAHVVIGTIFLAVCLFRLYAGQMSAKKHYGFEAAAWYWHFVDVVWLFLFAFVYVVPKLAME
jgi:cytochrome c oxidase subunit III